MKYMKSIPLLLLTASLAKSNTSAQWVMPITGLKEDPHIEFHIDMDYNLTDYLSISYLGLMDLYVKGDDQYKSSPVLFRRHDIGAEYTFDLGWVYLNTGIRHLSNGQTATNIRELNARRDIDGTITDFTLASVSRSFEYIPLTMVIDGFSATYQHFINKEDDVWWESGNTHTFTQYNGIELKYSRNLNSFIISAGIRTGNNSIDSLGNISYEIEISKKLEPINLWASVKYFDGWSNDLATYHLKKSYVGAGFTFEF